MNGAVPSLPPIVKAMMRPEFYPHHPKTVELVQTHISYVFLAGDFVYKLKKGVRFSFIDCSDLARRRHLCDEEIRLNRRLAPDVYLGKFPIFRRGDDFALGDQPIEHRDAVDYVIKMRRLPADRMLDRMLARHEADHATIEKLAAVVADFFKAGSSAHAMRHASAAALWRLVIGELMEAEQLVGSTLTAQQHSTIENFCRRFIASHWKLLNARAVAGHVREGHGDLRCEHICVEGGKISIFDCVEFSQQLRTCDLASEVAFLAMDLDRLEAPELADELIGAIAESTHDEEFPLLVPFYKCYRAVIRGVVESLRSREAEVAEHEREAALDLARRHFSLACSYAAEARPVIIVACGLSGSGKSTVAKALQYRFGLPIVSSDRTRKKLSSIPIDRSAADAYKSGIYADTVTESTYAAMMDEADHQLREEIGVIIDATFQDPAHREAARKLAAHHKMPILFLECRASDAEIRRRLIERQRKGHNPSDATVDVYLRQRKEFVALTEIAASQHLIVDTARPAGEIVIAVKNALERCRQ
ncbi:MAG TPA: AAA family ATPase [Candidatus Binataceae bacterium]|nr:AAA family ATPase [Candidatus Binataceae bacterium]